jgi:DNA polymerase-4
MPMFKAHALCPQAVVLPPDIARYRRVGSQLRAIMLDLTPLVEPLSIDEAFLDLSGTQALHKRSPAESLALLAQRAEKDLGITVSIGLSNNKFLAKIASDLQKPRGFSVIGQAETLEFLAARPISQIWGVGKATAARLAKDGLHQIAQLQTMTRQELTSRYGSLGGHLYALARGQDNRAVEPDAPPKSISSETTFDYDIADHDELLHAMWPLCESVSRRLKQSSLSGGTVHLKLKTEGFRLVSRQSALSQPTQLAENVFRAASQLLRREAVGPHYRLIGVGVSDLSHSAQESVDLADPGSLKRSKIERAMDEVRAKLGRDSIVKGRSLPLGRRSS